MTFYVYMDILNEIWYRDDELKKNRKKVIETLLKHSVANTPTNK
jgi:hypothetical protein